LVSFGFFLARTVHRPNSIGSSVLVQFTVVTSRHGQTTPHMGVSATGTLGGRRSSAEDARIEALQAARGWGLGTGLCPFPEKFMNFSSQNGVIWCILGVLFLRFMCHENDSDLRYSEVPQKGKNCQYTCQNIGGRDPCGVDAYDATTVASRAATDCDAA